MDSSKVAEDPTHQPEGIAPSEPHHGLWQLQWHCRKCPRSAASSEVEVRHDAIQKVTDDEVKMLAACCWTEYVGCLHLQAYHPNTPTMVISCTTVH